ncbi:MAG: Na/Pi cotransporter family protein [Erysipelotrichaceae bacterium]|nr:Na/Pi cotransporter family protein [Erysipelotrichaceae bacterium]
MTIFDIQQLFTFVGGLGMFLYGMHIMADGLQKTAGEKTKKLMGYLTNHRILGIVVGALITAIIQSSSATTVLVVGFVNASILSLNQAVGVIMGANIGTTMTAWLVSMSEWGSIFKPEFIAPLLVGIGALCVLFTHSDRKHQIGNILVGFGILFIGLASMSASVQPYSSSPIFAQIFATLGSNPILGIFVGAVVTAILQSSSASLGILQTLAMNGIVTWNSAVFIALGQNIGTCVTAMISSASAKPNAKKAAVIHMLFNTIGAVFFGILLYVFFRFNPVMGNSNISGLELAVFHTSFNIANTLLLFPFGNQLVKMANLIIHNQKKKETGLVHLDARLLEVPALALESISNEVNYMGKLAVENVDFACRALLERNQSMIEKVYEHEAKINQFEKEITAYLIHINNGDLTEHQQLTVKNLLYTASNLERVSDHCENIVELCQQLTEHETKFSEAGYADLQTMMNYTKSSLLYATTARVDMSLDAVGLVRVNEDMVDKTEKELREKHLRRLAEKKCEIEAGVVFLDVISNLERISDHAMNIADYVQEEVEQYA